MGDRSHHHPITVKVRIHIDFKPQITVSASELIQGTDEQRLNRLLEDKIRRLAETLKQIEIRDVEFDYGGRGRNVVPAAVPTGRTAVNPVVEMSVEPAIDAAVRPNFGIDPGQSK